MVTQAEEVANGGENRVGVVVWVLSYGRADGSPRIVEELILKPHGHVGDCIAVSFGKIRAGGE